ncbi:TPA: hypothetical protein ACKONR_000438 [Clostridioides difficile]|nr:hypothetical protein [Clostridioides difficile]MDV9854194.1 hypothetical protein [Clostridioides difficile]HBE9726995.1 hypothetical protein [Clostridioides difficile]HBF1102488.1 hypothetical protein [Clostridioides difficile]HBF1291788.1 hypothetical protein [Clostridioides difficile]
MNEENKKVTTLLQKLNYISSTEDEDILKRKEVIDTTIENFYSLGKCNTGLNLKSKQDTVK